MALLEIAKQSAASVPNAPAGSVIAFVDSADDILKTKDETGIVRVQGPGLASSLATTGDPVDVDSGAAPSPGYVLVAVTGPVAPVATYQDPRVARVSQNARITSPTPQIGNFIAQAGRLHLVDITGGNSIVQMPVAAGKLDQVVGIKNYGLASGNTITINRAGADTLDDAVSYTLTFDREWVFLQSDGVSRWVVVG
jgi:hypothetical protein